MCIFNKSKIITDIDELSEREKQIAHKIVNIIETSESVSNNLLYYSKYEKGDYAVSIVHVWKPIYSLLHLNNIIYTADERMVKYILKCRFDHKDEVALEKFLNYETL